MDNFLNRDMVIAILEKSKTLKEAILDIRQAPTVEIEEEEEKQ